MSLLHLEGVTVRYYPNTLAVGGVDLTLEKGEVLGIVGESGSGKSTLALSITRLIPSTIAKIQGNIFFEGVDLLSLSEKELSGYRGKKIASIFQEPGTALNPVLTLRDQLCEVLEIHQGVKGKQGEERAEFLLREVEIPHSSTVMKSYPHQLSGGMKQRVLIAMALASNPACLIADEPTSQLDVTIQVQILQLLKKIQREQELSMIFITHDLGVVGQMADRIAVMYKGKVVEMGEREAILKHPYHPYTQGLLQCALSSKVDSRRFYTIKGQPPKKSELSNECSFNKRCQKVIQQCREQEPPLEEVSAGRWVSCFRWKE